MQLVSDYGKLLIVGSVNVDMIMGVLDDLPRRGTEIMMKQSETRVGGNAANTAFAFQALGGRFQVVANIGADMFGEWVGTAFPEDSKAWPRSALPTTLSVGLTHSDGERTFLTSPGHLASFCLADVLGQQGIHVRAFADRPTWLRFGLPANQEGFRRLTTALSRQVPQKVWQTR